jgi:hypothetical protein
MRLKMCPKNLLRRSAFVEEIARASRKIEQFEKKIEYLNHKSLKFILT